MKVLVVPSNRPESLKAFFEAWEGKGGWDCSIVIEDGPERSFLTTAEEHFAWRDIDKLLGESNWIFSRRDSAIRCFGFLVAYHMGADHILTLDDDCLPLPGASPGTLFDHHIAAMEGHARWVSSVTALRVRGLPYRSLGTMPGVIANVGLWAGHPDLDAISSLSLMGSKAQPAYAVSRHNWLLPRGQYAPLCGMNLCFRRDAVPLFYFPLQGEGQPFRRFDDIWSGIIAKKLADHLGGSISIGEPFVEHRRASDSFVNLTKEAPGIAMNERFWEIIDRVPLKGASPTECVKELGVALVDADDAYIKKLGEALQVWAGLFSEGRITIG